MTARAPPGGGGESGRAEPVVAPTAGEFIGDVGRGEDFVARTVSVHHEFVRNGPLNVAASAVGWSVPGEFATAATLVHTGDGLQDQEDSLPQTAVEVADRLHGKHEDHGEEDDTSDDQDGQIRGAGADGGHDCSHDAVERGKGAKARQEAGEEESEDGSEEIEHRGGG